MDNWYGGKGLAGEGRIILDTNVFVAAGFNRRSRSAQLVERVRTHQLQMVWHPLTRKETQFIVGKIPPLSWEAISNLFEPEGEYIGELVLESYDYIADSEDRKFAALCHATQTPLVTMDRGLLAARDVDSLPILSPHEFFQASAKQGLGRS
ncbi:MAG: PIN domain-containing protein [Cyanobacteria bacterium P01_E01_bin.34]